MIMGRTAPTKQDRNKKLTIEEKPMKKTNKSATSLKALIQHAISDLEVTPAEYQAIMDLAHDDGVIDKEESALLSQLQQMISNGTVKRVCG
jgi:uncharacterized protein YutE (UPF0331/DUF86 family)